MTKTNTRSRIVSILLVLAMLLTMVPINAVTAFAAGNYPDYVRVYNGNNQITSLSDGQYLAANDATSQSSGYDGTQTYVARYDKSMGTLYLKGYQGVATEDSIFAGGDLNIVVEGDSSFTTSTTTTGNLYGIQADGGKLNISGSGKLTVTANGDGDVYGIYAKEGVTISAPLDVTVGENDTTKNGSVYGIYTKSGAISLSGEDKTITVTGGVGNVYGVYNAADTSTIADNGNIAISGKLTVKPSNGKYNRGISSQGGVITLDGATVRIPGNYYYGIYNENGNVIIKNGSDVDISSDISSNRGIITENGGSLTIDKSIVKVSSNGIVAEIYENASIKDSTVDLTLTDNHYEVIRADSTAANTIDLSGSGSVTLTATGKQDYAMFGGKVTLGTNTKCEKGTAISSWNNYAGEYDAVSNTTVLKFVHEDPAPATYTVSFDANGGTGTMADVTGVSGEYTLPANGFTAPAGKQFKGWATSAYGSVISGTTYEVSSDTTFYAIWESKEYSITVTDGKATIGAGSEISKAAEGTTVTLTANAAPSGKVFDKWEVVSGGITLADANSATTTFTMPASAVSVKATYKNAPHTHTYNQETVKPEALKTPADCTNNAVYFKSCSCGAISTTDTFAALGTALGHAYGSDWKYDSTNHWHECSRCHDKNDEAAHSASEWIIDTAATETAEGAKHKECTVCKKVLETATIPATGSSHTHSYGTDWKYDDTNHWHECECGDKADIAAHSASEWIIDTAATETAEGAKHKECTVCKKVLETATIPATGSSHTNSYGVYVGMTYTAGNLIYQITSIDTATVGQSKVIGVVAAKKNKITKITIPDRADCKGYRLNVTTIGNNAFAGCKALKKLTIGNKVTVIGKNAFKKCSKLETVVIGKAVKTISSKAFIGDNKIKKITFKGKKLKTVNKNAFSKKAKKNIKSKKTKLKGNKKAIKLFKKKLKIK